MKRLSIFCLSFILCSFVAVDFARAGSDISMNFRNTFIDSSNNIELLFSILDQEGSPIKGLNKSNFELKIQDQVLEEFDVEPASSDDKPLSVFMAVDVSASMEGDPMKEAKKAASLFLSQLGKNDYAALMTFGNNVRILLEFTQMKNKVKDEIKKIKATDMWTRLYQATHETIDEALNAPSSRIAIIILTDGKDEGSLKGEDEVFDRIRETDIPIYTVSFGQKANTDYLMRISNLSNGYFLYSPKAEDLTSLYGTVVEQLNNQYLVKFNFASKPEGDYKATLTFRYRGEEFVAQQIFSYPGALVLSEVSTKKAVPIQPIAKEWFKNPIVLAIIGGGGVMFIIIVLLLSKRRTETLAPPLIPDPISMKTCIPEIMVKRKIHKISSPLDDPEGVNDNTIFMQSKGEVALKIDFNGNYYDFPLVDNNNNKNYNEVIITRYSKDNDYLFSKSNVYILIPDNSVSRPDDNRKGHARIFVDNETGRYHIEDLGSSTFTKVNKAGLKKNHPLPLENSDKIELGEIKLDYSDERGNGKDTKF